MDVSGLESQLGIGSVKKKKVIKYLSRFQCEAGFFL
jgi:hypothetical protein